MRTAACLAALALLLAVPAAGATPGARIVFTESPGASMDVVALDADGTGCQNLTPGQQASYVSATSSSPTDSTRRGTA